MLTGVSRRYCYFTVVKPIEDMPTAELCSYCYVKRYEMMQSTPYSIYDKTYQSNLVFMNYKCGLSVPTDIPPPIEKLMDPYANNSTFCASDTRYITAFRDTCDTIALKHDVSSAALYMGNPNLLNCNNIPVGTELCLPFTCTPTYNLKDGDTCYSIEKSLGLRYASGYNVRKYNPWINCNSANLYDASPEEYGTTLCAGPQGGTANGTAPLPDKTLWDDFEIPPPTNVTVAEGTTFRCTRWHVVADQDGAEKETCTKICVQESLDWKLFVAGNPSLTAGVCDDKLVVGNAYCVGPDVHLFGDDEDDEDDEGDEIFY